MRFERKYRIENMTMRHVLLFIKMHPVSFRNIYPNIIINNIFFDTPHLASAQDNLDGSSIRKKYRLRWYGESQHIISKPMLETKYKENALGGKLHKKMPDFELKNLNDITKAVNDAIVQKTVLKPILLNSYERSYWGSPDGKFRVTVDHNLRFHSLMHSPNFQKYNCNDAAIIMEVKYEEEDEIDFDRIGKMFPFRLSKNSKYINGIFLTR